MPSMEEMIYFILFSPSECDSNATQEDVELSRASFNPFFLPILEPKELLVLVQKVVRELTDCNKRTDETTRR